MIYPVVFSYVNYYLSHLRREQQFDLIHHQTGNRLRHASGPIRLSNLLPVTFHPYSSASRSKFFCPLDYFFLFGLLVLVLRPQHEWVKIAEQKQMSFKVCQEKPIVCIGDPNKYLVKIDQCEQRFG